MAADRLLLLRNDAGGPAGGGEGESSGEGGDGEDDSRSGRGPSWITRGTVAIAAADIGKGGSGGKIPLDGDTAVGAADGASFSSSFQMSSKCSPRVLVDRGGGGRETGAVEAPPGVRSVELPSMATSDVSTPALDARLVPLLVNVDADAPVRCAHPSWSSPQLLRVTGPNEAGEWASETEKRLKFRIERRRTSNGRRDGARPFIALREGGGPRFAGCARVLRCSAGQ